MSSVSIAVVGSVNLDLVARIERFPFPGETLTDAVVSRHPGGKGANQALAAQRLGAHVSLAACVGDDPTADEALAPLAAAGVDLSHCRRLQDINSGLALILVSAEGENQIVVAPGANAEFSADRLALPAADAVIAQLEIPVETVLSLAQNSSGLFCLNAAPAKPVPRALLDRTDLLIVNEVEARALGADLDDYAGWLAVTYGAQGAVLRRGGHEVATAQPPAVEVVDTIGAGDAFTAALVVGMVSGLTPQRALQRACLVGALTTTRAGAQSSPLLAEVLQAEGGG
ncbi:MAG: ribokinase [Xanthomonadales bacterium]|nr:ribokinase [Xanthomonadales bacterium]